MEISKNILLLIFLGFSINGLTNSNPTEMIHYECPDEMACLTSQITINDELYNPELSVVEVANCGSRYNQENYKFEATSHDISFRLTWDVAGEDLKVGLVSGCMPYGNCIGESDCSSSQDITMEFEDLIIGHEYVVYVDACFFYPVDFELEITPGEPGEFSSVTGISTKQCDEQPDVYCNSLPIEIDVFYQDDDQEEYFEQAEGNWNFFVDGPESFDFTIDDIANASFNVTQFGNYVVCLESVALSCGSYEIDYCYELEVIDKSVDFGRLKVCEHELNEDDWVPSIHWDGDPISEPGFHIIETQDICGCDLFQQVEVIKLEEVEEFVEIELCPDDYPYTYFEDFEFEYSQFDIETNLVIHRGSLQEDYRRDECDSLVYLTLVNENPQDRCSSCDLPISLNKSKIVYCIPFDNEAIDVSGKRNIVLPVGIDFDDNGSSENILWDAVFDGDLDYVELPHISDLNTTDFSLDFKFNKDEDFENGPIETLFSKGDSEDNLRYIINVEQVTDQTFNLVARFYTESNVISFIKPNMELEKWYDITFVKDEGLISMYHDGVLFSEEVSLTALRGNEYDFIMGSYFEGSEKAQFYNGRINDFKYWKQKLSGQDVLFLHLPEKEFEVKQEFFLTCCEQRTIGDITIDIDNPLDSLIISNASPTGYDSTYIFGFIQNDPIPSVNESMIPDDIVVSYQQQCQEFCEATAIWDLSPEAIFSDNCNTLMFSQSHASPLLLDENISFVEVVYTASDNCGQTNSFILNLELECLPSEAESIPDQNEFITEVNESCVEIEMDAICKFSDIKFIPGFINYANQSFEAYDESSTLVMSLSVNGASRQIEISEIQEGIEIPELKEEGSYQVCFESISNECQTNEVNYCETINIKGSSTIDHGTIVACPSSLKDVLPVEISQDLRTLILNNPLETRIEISYEDDCSCIVQEGIKIEFATDETPEELVLEACPDEFPLTVLDLEIMESDVYEQTLLYFDNASYSSDANGSACDSSVLLTVIKKPIFEEFVNAEICEGEVFETYAETGQYEDVFVAENGCDSIRILSLEILPKSYEDIFVEICPDSTYLGFSEEGVYEIVNTNVFGCDSITTLDLDVLDESDPACMVSSLNHDHHIVLNLYPNPTADVIRFNLNETAVREIDIEIINHQGKIVKALQSSKGVIDVSNLNSGLYFLSLRYNDFDFIYRKFIKR